MSSIKEVAHDKAHDHIDHVAHCPITHVPHPPRCPISIFSINHDTHLPAFPIAHMSKKMSSCQKAVKLSKRCQVVKKMSNVKKSNTQTMEEVHKKKKFTQWGSHILMSILMSNMKVTKIVQKHFLCTFWGFLVTIICDIKIDISMCEPHFMSIYYFLWTSSIIPVFDFLTFDIFLTTWHLFDNLTSFLTYGQWKMWANGYHG